LLISHRFSSVRMAERILVLSGGRVEAAGSYEELLAQDGRYAERFELRAAGYRGAATCHFLRCYDEQEILHVSSTPICLMNFGVRGFCGDEW
jgi:hypothetical protein